jgi:uncharacterized protein YndB with AHSA1/START domain
MAEPKLARFLDRYTVEYVRIYPHPIERVWRAVTDASEISIWFWQGTSEAELGGAYLFGPEDSGFKGVITAFEPPRLVRYAGPTRGGKESYFQCELTRVDGGTQLVFTQSIPPGGPKPDWPRDPPGTPDDTPWWPGTLSGWHRSLDHLGVLMDGGTWRRADQAARDALDQRYREHMLTTLP